jgi:phage-related holin
MASTYQLQRIIPTLDFLELVGISFLAVTEFLSIVENLSVSGLIIPRWIVVRLEKYLETGQLDIIQTKSLKRIKS